MVVEAGLGVAELRTGVCGSLGTLTLVAATAGEGAAAGSLMVVPGTSLMPGPAVKVNAVSETVLGGSFRETEVEVEESSRAERCVEEREEEAEEERRGGGEETRGSSSPPMVQLSWPDPSRCWCAGGSKG